MKPMHDLPDHWLLPVNLAEQGPVAYDDAVRWACACGGRDDCPYNDPLPEVDCKNCASPNEPLRVWCAACATMLPRPPMTLPGLES